ncbi:MAG: glycosyltransferase family 2 protein [Deltaproteobacteria bacterium]|nr:glycosyltransferase family 2 protein [Deltaproteobacteria bacterium]
MKYLIVIPAYNEERYIASLLNNLPVVTRDIIVVDDGSKDATYQIVQKIGIPVIRQPHQGKGAALKTGFKYAIENGYDWVITIDGDGQHDWKDIPRFIETISKGGADVIIGSRMADVAAMPIVRRVTNKFMSSLLSKLIGHYIADTQCGFRAINSKVLRDIVLETSHYDTESELLIKAGRAKYNISSIPIRTIYNGSQSNINKFVDTMRFVKLLWKAL